MNHHQKTLENLRCNVESVNIGAPDTIKLTLIMLFACGFLLIEDASGAGKTSLAYALAQLLQITFRRIQFTSDMLPTGITGLSIYSQ